MTTLLNAERLAKIEARAAATQDWATQSYAPEHAILLAHVDVPDLLAEVKRLAAELAKYTGWEPTVREEHEHACGQVGSDRWRTAFDALHARLLRDLPCDGSELPQPDDEFWAAQLDGLVTYADQLHRETETGGTR